MECSGGKHMACTRVWVLKLNLVMRRKARLKRARGLPVAAEAHTLALLLLPNCQAKGECEGGKRERKRGEGKRGEGEGGEMGGGKGEDRERERRERGDRGKGIHTHTLTHSLTHSLAHSLTSLMFAQIKPKVAMERGSCTLHGRNKTRLVCGCGW